MRIVYIMMIFPSLPILNILNSRCKYFLQRCEVRCSPAKNKTSTSAAAVNKAVRKIGTENKNTAKTGEASQNQKYLK